jgi:hypothetical protein
VFFLFGVLKFLEPILYILVDHVCYLLHEFLSDFFPDIFFEELLLASLISFVTFLIVLLRSGTGYPFSSFPSELCIELFF